ncbi:MAG: anaerobic ribonucleoside triphosphate reductase [Opitutales bacterium]|nr:anaerobic ribonucleoside triphosphate reductase [Opitutales bacterium]
MDTKEISILKRDGKTEDFSPDKIKRAITKAFAAGGLLNEERLIDGITKRVVKSIEKKLISVEEIQDIVERELMASNPYIAKKYIIYREWRTVERDKRTSMKQVMDGIVKIEKNDVNLSNANMSAHTPAGQMMTFASEVTKDYACKYLLGVKYARAHRNGDIHIHDLDYYPTKTTTCVQYDLEDIFERGFHTKNGSIRTPQSIQSYATLATIVFQTNQNEQHGGQSIPAFDFFMAPGVRKSFVKHVASETEFAARLEGNEKVDVKKLKNALSPLITSIELGKKEKSAVLKAIEKNGVKLSAAAFDAVLAQALENTRRDTHQAMEGLIHNLNTMHSRGGNQVVFSSINYGTDSSPEGRMVMKELLDATVEGLGSGEVPVFPIQIFKVKDGVSFSEADYEKAVKDLPAAMSGKIKFEAPNFDLLLLACKTTSTSLFPNFLFLDTPYNKHEKWRADDPKRYHYELATMGCRTRVFENLHGEKTSFGRGNLSFTSINMPRLAIEAMHEAEENCPNADKHALRREAKFLFMRKVRDMTELVAEQLYERYQYQRTARACQFPFMMSNGVWKGGMELGPADQVGDVINSGTLGIGFIGGHNAMVAIFGEGHAHNKEAWDTLYEAIEVMNEVVNSYKKKYNLNYSVLATPAEGLAGRFTRMDRKRYGVIEGVTDRDYYVNSFHIDVREPVSIVEKIKLEAPFHAITKGGHITYVELDGEAKKNVLSILKIVKTMKDENIGYGSINHPVDTCKDCGYKGVIYASCPNCKSENISRMRRITGYLTGSLETWNSAKQAEERDRVKHS